MRLCLTGRKDAIYWAILFFSQGPLENFCSVEACHFWGNFFFFPFHIRFFVESDKWEIPSQHLHALPDKGGGNQYHVSFSFSISIIHRCYFIILNMNNILRYPIYLLSSNL